MSWKGTLIRDTRVFRVEEGVTLTTGGPALSPVVLKMKMKEINSIISKVLSASVFSTMVPHALPGALHPHAPS